MRTLPGDFSNDSTDFRLAFKSTDSFNVNSLGGSNNNVFLDGAINTDGGANDGQFTQISLDAVGEFKVQSSMFNAEFGRNPGIMISVNTKSGTKDFHGTPYEFPRNNALDPRQPSGGTGTTQNLRSKQVGGKIIPRSDWFRNAPAFFKVFQGFSRFFKVFQGVNYAGTIPTPTSPISPRHSGWASKRASWAGALASWTSTWKCRN